MWRRVVLALAVVLAAGMVTLRLLEGDPTPREPEPTTNEAASGPPAPRLAGAAPAGGPSAAREDATPWIEALASDDAARQAEAVTRLRGRIKSHDLSPEELLRVALLPAGEGGRDRVRALALQALAAMRCDALPLLPRLLDLLERGSEHEVAVAARVTATLAGSDAHYGLRMPLSDDAERPSAADLKPYLPRIGAIVSDGDADLAARLTMLPLLQALGGESVETVPALIDWIQGIEKEREEFLKSNPMIHVSWDHFEFQIAEVLSSIGAPALPAILAVLREDDPHGEYELEMAIREMGPDALEALLGLLSDADPDIRANALTAVVANTEDPTETLALLREAMRDAAASVRATAVSCSKGYGTEVGPELVAALADPDDDVRAAAARALEAAPEAAESALPTLIEMLKEGEYAEQLSTLGVLEKLGPVAVEAAPYVLSHLAAVPESGYARDMFTDSYLSTLTALGEGAIPALVEAAAGEKATLRRAAVEALILFDDVEARRLEPLAGVLPRLAGADRMRLAALLALHDHPAATHALLAGLASEERETRTAAAQGLQHAGSSAIHALPKLVAGLRENYIRLHAEGADWGAEWDPCYAYDLAVSHVGSHAPSELVPLLGDENEVVAEAASRGVAQAGERGIAALDAHWSRIPPRGRIEAVKALARLAFAEEPAEGARARVVAALEDPDPGVRLAAARAAAAPDLRARVVPVYLGLLSAGDEEIAEDAAYRLRGLGAALMPWEAELRAAQPAEESTARRWVQDALDAIEDAR